MPGQEPERIEIDGFFREIFSSEVSHIEYSAHPSESVLKSYLLGKVPTGWNGPEVQLDALRNESSDREWYRNDVTAHLITCRNCQRQIETIREHVAESPSFSDWVASVILSIRRQFKTTSRPALATIAVQGMIIVVLGVLLATNSAFDGSTAALNGASTVNNSADSLPEPARAINNSDLARSFGLATDDEKLRMAQEFSDTPNINLLPAITQMMTRETDEEILSLLGDAFNNSLASINSALGQTIDQIDEYRIKSNRLTEFPDPNKIDELQNSLAALNRSVRKLNLSAELAVLVCEPRAQSLSLAALDPILNQFAGALVYDPQSESRFEVQLPPLYAERAIPMLEQQVGLACSQF